MGRAEEKQGSIASHSMRELRARQQVACMELRTKKNTDGARFFLTLIFAKTIPSLAAKNSLQLIRLITGRTGKMATKKAAKKVAKKAAKKK
jgi:hypothetical protein